MGAVYKVRPKNALYALKVILSHSGLETMARFEREAQAAAAVDSHPNIVGIHKLEVNSANPYIIFDLVEGQGLDLIVERPDL